VLPEVRELICCAAVVVWGLLREEQERLTKYFAVRVQALAGTGDLEPLVSVCCSPATQYTVRKDVAATLSWRGVVPVISPLICFSLKAALFATSSGVRR